MTRHARAEVRVTNELIREFKRVTGKEYLLFRVAEATVDAGDKLVRDAVYPVAPQAVLRDLVAGVQDVLADPDGDGMLTADDERGLTRVLVARAALRRSQT